MDNQSAQILWLSLIVFLPAIGAIFLAFLPKDNDDLIRYVTLAFTGAVFVLTLLVFALPGMLGSPNLHFDYLNDAAAYMQDVFNVNWIPSFDIFYSMGIDGISFPLIMLTSFISLLAMGASWSIKKHVKAYCILFLLLETGMLGVFMALDFFLFYVFWEVMLLPMYFLIGVWGGSRREYAAIKFFLYTLLGSVLMLIAILMLYFCSDLRTLAETDFNWNRSYEAMDWDQAHIAPSAESQVGRGTSGTSDDKNQIVFLRQGVAADQQLAIRFVPGGGDAAVARFNPNRATLTVELPEGQRRAAVAVAAIHENEQVASEVVDAKLAAGSDGSGAPEDEVFLSPYRADVKVHTFNIVALAAMGQKTDLFTKDVFLGHNVQWWAFLLLFIGFAIKVPSVPLHTWLPDAHVEAPTPISMILAGILLKMGGYGIIRICYPICPDGGFDLRWFVCIVGVVSMVYGAYAALAQKDFKRMVAYSSVSHMGYVVLGLGVWSATATLRDGQLYNPYYWNMGIKGAMFQMIGHGISSAGMFFLVGVIYDRVHHRNLNEFGGLFSKMPVYTALSIGIFFAGLGLPGLCGFIGEVFVVLSVWNFSQALAVISAFVVILTAGYILWAIQRVYLGAEYKGPHEEALVPSTPRENLIAGVLFVMAILFGVFPHQMLLKYMDKTIDRQTQELADWTRYVKDAGYAEPYEEPGGPALVAPQPEPADALTARPQSAAAASRPLESTPTADNNRPAKPASAAAEALDDRVAVEARDAAAAPFPTAESSRVPSAP